MKRLSNQRGVLCALTHHAHTLVLRTLIYRSSSKRFPRKICEGRRGPFWNPISSAPLARGCVRCRNCAKALASWERSTSQSLLDGCSDTRWTSFMERESIYFSQANPLARKWPSLALDPRDFLAPGNWRNVDTV